MRPWGMSLRVKKVTFLMISFDPPCNHQGKRYYYFPNVFSFPSLMYFGQGLDHRNRELLIHPPRFHYQLSIPFRFWHGIMMMHYYNSLDMECDKRPPCSCITTHCCSQCTDMDEHESLLCGFLVSDNYNSIPSVLHGMGTSSHVTPINAYLLK